MKRDSPSPKRSIESARVSGRAELLQTRTNRAAVSVAICFRGGDTERPCRARPIDGQQKSNLNLPNSTLLGEIPALIIHKFFKQSEYFKRFKHHQRAPALDNMNGPGTRSYRRALSYNAKIDSDFPVKIFGTPLAPRKEEFSFFSPKARWIQFLT